MKTALGSLRLEALLESAQLLYGSLELDTLLRHLLRTVMGRFLVSKALIAVADEGGTLRLALVRGLSELKAGEPFDEARCRAAGVQRCCNIGGPDDLAGVLGLGPVMRDMDSSDEEFLKALLGIAASGVRNAAAHARTKKLNRDLAQKVQDLRTLLELVQGLTATLEAERVAHLLALTLTGRWAVGRYAVAAWKDGHEPVVQQRGIQLPDLDLLRQEIQPVERAVTLEKLPKSALRKALEDRQGAALIPLRSGDNVLGCVALGRRPGGQKYGDADLEFASGLAAQAVVAFENSWHFRETLEKKKIEQELGVAAAIQKDLFPAAIPAISGLDLAARSLAARQVGGDYFDVLPVGAGSHDSPHLLCVADVSGKGIPAALLMSSIQATLRALLAEELSVVKLVYKTSQLLYATTPSNKYATAIIAVVDPRSGELRFVNAGHNDGILLRVDGSVMRLKSTGPPLGLLPQLPFQEETVRLQNGDLLALYSDGVVEAQNSAEQEFEEARLLHSLSEARHNRAEEIVERIFQDVTQFAGSAPQYDDITVMLAKRLP